MRRWHTATGVLLLGLSFLAGNVGNLSIPFRECLALALWAPVLYLEARPLFIRACTGRKLAAGVLVLLMGLGFIAGSHYAMASLLLSLLVFPTLEKGLESSDADFQVLFLTMCLVGSWTLLQDLLPHTFLVLDHLSALCCGLSSFIVGQPIEFGPTYSGIWFLILFVSYHVSVFVLSEPRRGLLLAGMIAGQLILLVLYQILFHLLLAKWQVDSAWVILGVAQLGLFALGFGLILLHQRRANLKPVPWRVRPAPITALGIASFLLVLCASGTPARFFSHFAPSKVLLYDDRTLDWSVPVYGQYGGIRGGMFGSLAEFLQRRGCEASRGALTNGALERANVLVVFNLMHKFQPEEKRQIWDFVARGGALLAVASSDCSMAPTFSFRHVVHPGRAVRRGDSDREYSRFELPDTLLIHEPNVDFHTFYTWVQRVGYEPRVGSSLEQCLERADGLVMINPSGRIRNAALCRLRSFVANGGVLFVLGSSTNSNSCANEILSAFGAALANTVAAEQLIVDKTGKAVAANRKASPSLAGEGVLFTQERQPVLSLKRAGNGTIIFSADAELFSNASLGSTGTMPNEMQMRLYRVIFDLFRQVNDSKRPARS